MSFSNRLVNETFDKCTVCVLWNNALLVFVGGTDIIACFMGQNPSIPVYRGEIQARNLAMGVEAWSEEGNCVSAKFYLYYVYMLQYCSNNDVQSLCYLCTVVYCNSTMCGFFIYSFLNDWLNNLLTIYTTPLSKPLVLLTVYFASLSKPALLQSIIIKT